MLGYQICRYTGGACRLVKKQLFKYQKALLLDVQFRVLQQRDQFRRERHVEIGDEVDFALARVVPEDGLSRVHGGAHGGLLHVGGEEVELGGGIGAKEIVVVVAAGDAVGGSGANERSDGEE